MYQEKFMRRALELSASALTLPGTEPFGAVIVKDGQIVGEGLNHSLAHFDPTSHGETEAIRDACRKLQTVDLRGCELYTSAEPCALCVAAMVISGIGQLYYAASLDQCGPIFDKLPLAERFPIDVAHLRAECGGPVQGRALPAEQKLDDEAVAILKAWAAPRLA
ncbi:tRNA(Arg) A34 adenosine deaminase TadA [Gemmobacter aquatilis]|uniref:tRNA(Arg) A34 adenosine deaminase TadA n=1 Tax=Gemmobacter aquatilis TaxID=933059 RepID=A0A1H8GPZ8_9RHOB|nr:nucleoside deaminase [Gemmobacter aquatilis]SEN45910.1 tRNA(Arg) A34 adenosine deaminase TadA [Gemmobacter aquatilis]